MVARIFSKELSRARGIAAVLHFVLTANNAGILRGEIGVFELISLRLGYRLSLEYACWNCQCGQRKNPTTIDLHLMSPVLTQLLFRHWQADATPRVRSKRRRQRKPQNGAGKQGDTHSLHARAPSRRGTRENISVIQTKFVNHSVHEQPSFFAGCCTFD